MGRLSPATCAALLLLLICCTLLHAQESGRKCWKRCPKGQQCKLERKCVKHFCFSVPVCVEPPKPAGPPSCQDVSCDGRKVCVLQEVICVTHPCHPLPVCIEDQCTSKSCPDPGTRCLTVRKPGSPPACTTFPDCQFTTACVPRAKPKPGFCPAREQVSNANVNQCDYDNDCASDLLCCPGTSRGGLNCTAPAYPNPCGGDKCKTKLFAPHCVVRNGMSLCLDRVCDPGDYFCRDEKQCFCSQGGSIICTSLPC